MWALVSFFFFYCMGEGWGLNFTRLAVRQWHFWSERFYREERKRESGARHIASGRKTELSCLQRCFLDEQSRYAHVKIKVEKGGRGRGWLVRCPSGQPWVQLDLSVGVRAFPLQGCLAPPPPLPIVWQCRVGELYPCLVRDTAFKSFAWSRIRLHTVHLLHNENPST